MNIDIGTVPEKLYFIESISHETGKLICYVQGYSSSYIPKLYRKGPAKGLINALNAILKRRINPENFYRLRSVTLTLDSIPGISNIEECGHSFTGEPTTLSPETKLWTCEKCGHEQIFQLDKGERNG